MIYDIDEQIEGTVTEIDVINSFPHPITPHFL